MTRLGLIFGVVLLFVGFYLLLNQWEASPNWATSAAQPTDFESWIDYQSDSGFSVKFPNQPQSTTQSMVDKQTGEKRAYTIYASDTPDGKAFMVTVITFSEDAMQQSGQKLARKIVMEIINRKEENSLETIETGIILNQPAIDFAVSGSATKMQGTAFMRDKRLYLLTEVVPIDMETDQFDYFRNSFRIGG